MNNAVFGIDIGATTTTLGIVNEKGNLLKEGQILTLAHEHVTRFLPRLYREMESMGSGVSELEVKAIGIGAPNSNFYKGTIQKPANLSWGDETPIVDLVHEKYGIPVFLTNDANAATIGEMKFGCAKKMKNFLMITLGSGLGSGIVVDGKIVHGSTAFAGELGHLLVKEDGRESAFGRRGSLESYVSVTGLRRTVAKFLADSKSYSKLREVSYNDLTGEMISDAAVHGDPIALEAFEYTGMFLGKALANSVLYLSPEAIVLFGGLANAKDLIFQPTLKHMEKNMMPIFKGTVKLLLSELQNKNAAVLGASALAWAELEEAQKVKES